MSEKANIHLEYTPKQQEALVYLTNYDHFAEVEYCLYGGAAGGGKSWLGVMWLFYMCHNYDDLRYFIGRKQLKDIKESTIVTLYKFLKYYGLKHDEIIRYDKQSGNITFKRTGSTITALDLRYMPSDPYYERYGSQEFTGGWIEEGGEVHEQAFDTLKSRIGRYNNDKEGIPRKMLITCNPKRNWMYNHFYRPWREKTLAKDKAFVQAFVQDNVKGESSYRESLQGITDKALRERLLMGNWEYDDTPAKLFKYDDILNMWSNEYTRGGRRYMSCDIAGEGDDYLVIFVWEGLNVIYYKVLERSDGKVVYDLIRKMAAEHRVPTSNIVFDADGLGNYLKGFLRNARPFVNNSKQVFTGVRNKQFANLKSQVYWKLAEYIEEGKIAITADLAQPHKVNLEEELSVMENISYGTDNKLQVTRKQEAKELLGRSPDFSDALAYRMYYDLLPKRGITTHQ